MTGEVRRTEHCYGEELEVMVASQCQEPCEGVAQVAMSYGINDNVVHSCRQLAREGNGTLPKSGEFIALPLGAPAAVAAVAQMSQSDSDARR